MTRLVGAWVPACVAAMLGCAGAPAPIPPAAKTGAAIVSADRTAEARLIADIVARLAPSIVAVTGEQLADARSEEDGAGEPNDDEESSGAREDEPYWSVARTEATGFVVDGEGHVATNAHVVEATRRLRVRLADGRELRASVRAADPEVDLAVLDVEWEHSPPPPLPLGSAESLHIGDPVVALGNGFGLGESVTAGIVSATHRFIGMGRYDDLIQTDASVQPGFSGGPLVDRSGRVVAINVALARATGFAIPIEALTEMLPTLLATGRYDRGCLGLTVQAVDSTMARALGLPVPRGALVADLEPAGAALRGGVERGDVILAVGDTPIERAEALARVVGRRAPGTKVEIHLARGGTAITRDVTLERAPAAPLTRPPLWFVERAADLGIELEAAGGRVRVVHVAPGSALDGRLEVGDTIVEVDHEPVATPGEVLRRLAAPLPNRPALVVIERQGTTRFVAVDAP